MTPETILQLSKIFKAAADPNRQRIMFLLREKGEMNVGDIAESLHLTQPAASQHLRVLKDVEALLSRKSGQQIYYRLCSERLCDAFGDFMQVYQEEITKANKAIKTHYEQN